MTNVGRRALLARGGWGIADQALSSLTNFALTVLVARSVTESEFGAFAIAVLVYLTVLGIVRGLLAEPLAVRFSAAPPAARNQASAAATGASVWAGALVGAGLLVVATFFGGTTRSVLLALGISMPGLALQDAWRFVFVTEGRPARAAANDLVWALAQFGAVGALLAFTDAGAGAFVLAWGLAANVAALVGCAQAGMLPALGAGPRWARRHLDLGGPFALDFTAQVGGSYVSLFVVTAIAGLDAVAGLRGAQVLLGPVNVLYLGARLIAVPEGARLAARGGRAVVRLSAVVALALGAAAAVVGTILLLLPDSIGTELLGDTWDAARRVLLPTTLLMAANGIGVAAVTGLRSLAAARESLRARLLVAPLLVVGATIGVVVAGEAGAAWGLAATGVIGAAIWWFGYLRIARAAGPVRAPTEGLADVLAEGVTDTDR